jgi:hypothetical protein
MKLRKLLRVFVLGELGITVLLGFFSPLAAGEEIVYDSGGRRNPFVPLIGAGAIAQSSSQVKTTDLVVDGIIYDPTGGSIVVIKGESYKEGAQIKNITIVSILKDRVILKQNDAEKVLWIREEVVDNNIKKKQ